MEATRQVIGGVDTHQDSHVVAALDHLGRQIGSSSFPSTGEGCRAILDWLRHFGQLDRVGVEGCGSSGAGLARLLRSEGVEVIEICRPNRQMRRRRGSRTCSTLRLQHETAPQNSRDRFNEPKIDKLVDRLLGAEAGAINDQAGYESAVRSLASRWKALDTEAAELASKLKMVVIETAPPELLELQGVGPDVAAALMIAAGDNPERLRSEASFAALCGVSPLDCSSGRQHRHRLNRGGNRDANMALWRIVMVRLRWDPTTRACSQHPAPPQSLLDNKRSIGTRTSTPRARTRDAHELRGGLESIRRPMRQAVVRGKAPTE